MVFFKSVSFHLPDLWLRGPGVIHTDSAWGASAPEYSLGLTLTFAQPEGLALTLDRGVVVGAGHVCGESFVAQVSTVTY